MSLWGPFVFWTKLLMWNTTLRLLGHTLKQNKFSCLSGWEIFSLTASVEAEALLFMTPVLSLFYRSRTLPLLVKISKIKWQSFLVLLNFQRFPSVAKFWSFCWFSFHWVPFKLKKVMSLVITQLLTILGLIGKVFKIILEMLLGRIYFIFWYFCLHNHLL